MAVGWPSSPCTSDRLPLHHHGDGTSTMTETAPELARNLGVDAKLLRAFLRRTATDHRLGDRWVIDQTLAEQARAHFADQASSAGSAFHP
jgi:hypothetical protein